MNSQEFIIDKLRNLSYKYSDLKIRYEFRANTLSHIVEILPVTFFETKLEFIVDEVELEKEFEQAYPLENIVFVSENSLTEIRRVDLELGYDGKIYIYSDSLPEFEVVGYSDVIETTMTQNTYALAA
ncbi:MAG: hypothetical protein LWX70_12715 [Sphingobacteriia bacterium]|nr:hypothetical protein [Sphingobacteriia bacterium]